MFLKRQVCKHLRLFPAPILTATQDGQEFGPLSPPTLAKPVSLDVLVQQRDRIELLAIEFTEFVDRHPLVHGTHAQQLVNCSVCVEQSTIKKQDIENAGAGAGT
jgi:hypothetical protein